MIKDFLLIRAKPVVPQGMLKYRDYVEQVHVPRAMGNPAIAREMKRFTLNHLVDETPRGVCLLPAKAGLTTVVEHKVGGWEAMQRIMADPEYLAVVRPCEVHMSENLFDGEPQFVVVEDEREIFSCDAPGAARMLDFIQRPASITREEFQARLEEDGAWAAEDPRYRAAVGRRVHSIVGEGAPPFGAVGDPFDAVIEVWISDAGKLAELMDERSKRFVAFCDPDRSFTAMTQEHRIV